MPQKLKYKDKISRKNSQEMIYMLARHGDHNIKKDFLNGKKIKIFFENIGIAFDKLVQDCRKFDEQVPYVENLLSGSTWDLVSGTGSIVDKETGETVRELRSPCQFTLDRYKSTFSLAKKKLESAIENSSYTEFEGAVIDGIKSIEAFLNYLAERWNIKHVDDQLIDNRESRLNSIAKIDDWIPKITGGRKFDKSDRNWKKFFELKRLRNEAMHPKCSIHVSELDDLCSKINDFRFGIAGILIKLHKITNYAIPSSIIRVYFSPDVEIAEDN